MLWQNYSFSLSHQIIRFCLQCDNSILCFWLELTKFRFNFKFPENVLLELVAFWIYIYESNLVSRFSGKQIQSQKKNVVQKIVCKFRGMDHTFFISKLKIREKKPILLEENTLANTVRHLTCIWNFWYLQESAKTKICLVYHNWYSR